MGKRDDILNTTLQLIWEEGIEEVTFAKIFDRGNVGAGTFYHYFAGKDEVIHTLYERSVEHMEIEVLKGYEDAASIWLQFETLLRNLARFAKQYPAEMWLVDSYVTSPNIPKELRNKENQIKVAGAQLIRNGQAQWQIREINPDLGIEMVTGMLIHALKGERIDRYTLNDRSLQEVIDGCWRAIKM